MKKFRKIFIGALAALMSIMAVPSSVSAANFRDVGPALSWAQEAINAVAEIGIMTGDLSGNFNPNGTIDKFEAMRIFARMMGFNPIHHTVAQRAYYDSVFEARRGIIEQHDNQFVLWNSAMNREIAYLLYEGILTPADLDTFIITQGGFEARRNITREEVAVYLTRFLGGEQSAMQTFGVPLFTDDHLITPSMRPHIYYLRSLGILNGSGGAVDPRATINRAAMAMLVHSTLQHSNSPLLSGSGSTQTPPSGNNPVVENISGSIINAFPQIRSIFTQSANQAHNNRVYPVAQNAIITINNTAAQFAQLEANMTFAAILASGEIVSIHASAPNNNNTSNNTNNTNNNQNNTNIPNVADMRVLDGTVVRTSVANRTIGIETRTINPRGEIISETRDYSIINSTTITRNSNNITLNNITAGDLIVAHVYGNTAHIVSLEERVRQVSGVLVEKNFGTNTSFPSIVIEDTNGNRHSFTADSTSQISRGNFRNLNTRSLRVGDHVDLWAENGRVTQIQARAVPRVSVDVYIRAIFISGQGQSFVVTNTGIQGAEDVMHLLVDGHVDPFDLTLGSRVRLWFDSEEVIGVATLHGVGSTNFTGHIQNVTGNQIVVRDANFQTRTFTVDNNTVYVNSITGQVVNLNSLGIGMNINIITSPNQTNRAVSVTIISH